MSGIQAAIDAASPGDVIVLMSNGGTPDHLPFTLNKGVTIRGNGSRVGNPPGVNQSIFVHVPAGQVAHVDGIDTTYSHGGALGNVGCNLLVQGGSVRFENCTLDAALPLRITNATVVVTGGTITANGNGSTNAGVDATTSHVTLRDCTVTGATSTCNPTCTALLPATPALTAFQSTIHAERVQFAGGSNAFPLVSGAHGAEVIASNVRLADCTVAGGASVNFNAGVAIANSGGVVELRNTTLLPGNPGGPTSLGPIDPNAPLVRLALAPAWLRGATSTFACSGDPNTLFAIGFAPDVSPTPVPAVAAEALWLLGGALIAVGLLDPTGNASFAVAVPNTPSLQHLTVWCQAISGTALPLRASTIAGGVIR